jgi:hypothetical protein
VRSCVDVSTTQLYQRRKFINSLSSVGLVVHEEKVEVAGVVDEESLVARRHHVAGLPVVAVADL